MNVTTYTRSGPKCPVCGRRGKVRRFPMTRGKNAGRVRVEIVHVQFWEDGGICRLVRDYDSCSHWEDDPTTDTYRHELGSTAN